MCAKKTKSNADSPSFSSSRRGCLRRLRSKFKKWLSRMFTKNNSTSSRSSDKIAEHCDEDPEKVEMREDPVMVIESYVTSLMSSAVKNVAAKLVTIKKDGVDEESIELSKNSCLVTNTTVVDDVPLVQFKKITSEEECTINQKGKFLAMISNIGFSPAQSDLAMIYYTYLIAILKYCKDNATKTDLRMDVKNHLALYECELNKKEGVQPKQHL